MGSDGVGTQRDANFFLPEAHEILRISEVLSPEPEPASRIVLSKVVPAGLTKISGRPTYDEFPGRKKQQDPQ